MFKGIPADARNLWVEHDAYYEFATAPCSETEIRVRLGRITDGHIAVAGGRSNFTFPETYWQKMRLACAMVEKPTILRPVEASYHVLRGIAQQGFVKEIYEAHSKLRTREPGFCVPKDPFGEDGARLFSARDSHEAFDIGASPDLITIAGDVVAEIKAPAHLDDFFEDYYWIIEKAHLSTHGQVGNVEVVSLPLYESNQCHIRGEHYCQMLCQMAVMGAAVCDYLLYVANDPRNIAGRGPGTLYIQRVPFNQKDWGKLLRDCSRFLRVMRESLDFFPRFDPK